MSVSIEVPSEGARITRNDGRLEVPDNPIIPFIEGDGIGPDIWRASVRVLDAAIDKAYDGKRRIHWMEVYAGGKANELYGSWLPDESVQACRDYLVSIKGPLTTPVGGGIRSLNVALRQIMDLYVCLRPVRWYQGVPSPVKHPERVNMAIFRENTESNSRTAPRRTGSSWNCSRNTSPPLIAIYVSPIPPASASSPSPRRAPHGWCGPPFNTPWTTAARASPWCTRVTS